MTTDSADQVLTTAARALPPGVDADQFDRFLARVAETLPADRILTSDAALREYRDPYAFETWDDFTAAAAVLPTSTPEVQAVVRAANEFRIPLYTHSQGRNNGYGGPAPRVRGSVVVSLREMNRVLEINEELAYAVVEPGVRWFDLYDALEAGGHRLFAAIADLGWGSVVGNSLDNGITYGPHGQDFGAPCGMEVVLPDGSLLRTGMGAMEGNPAWHTYKRGLGPTLDPLFIQSNYGIVTRMGVWLHPKPEVLHPWFVKAEREEALGPLLDTLRRLRLDGTIQGVPSLRNTLLLASVLTRRSAWTDSADPLDDATIDRIAAETGIGRWSGRGALWGDRVVVEHNFAKVKRAFEEIPGVSVTGEPIPFEDVPQRTSYAERIVGGVPNMDILNVVGWYGGSDNGGHLSFSPVVALTSADGVATNRFLRDLIEREAGLDYQVAMFNVSARSMVNVVMMMYDASDEAQTKRAHDTVKLMVGEAGKRGMGEYRAHLDFMDLAADQFAFGDHAYRRFVERIKDAVDPHGILAPGRHGIWPAGTGRRAEG
jgi:4-cresol dehydrogenase (hydroxylating) flavoprotein subunit